MFSLASIRLHFSSDDCLEDKREDIRTVICCIVFISCAQCYTIHIFECWFRFSICVFFVLP